MLVAEDVIDNQPLISQKGNFSGKVSAVIKSWLPTEWWYNSPTTGGFQAVVTERSDQFHVPMGWVDIPLAGKARDVSVPTTLPPNFKGNTILPKTKPPRLPRKEESGPFYKQFLWRTDEEASVVPFSTIPTKY